MKDDREEKKSLVERMAGFIVDKRNGFFLMYIGLAIFCTIASGWVTVNNDLTSYLPEETETKQGLTIMDDEFTTFATAAILNKGTNFLFGEISFVSNSIAVVLQLALAIDYAIILCHRYSEERVIMQPREAAATALSKAIPEIAGSCLTTISGLGAMMFMRFKIGFDMGMVLIKAICISIICVFTLMPGLLMLFSGLIDKTPHKNFVPNITPVGKAALKTRYVIPPVFAVLLVAAFIFSNKCPYVYGYSTLHTAKQNETQIAEQKIDDTFGGDNLMALIVPSGNYKAEAELLNELEQIDGVDYTMGLSNIEAVDGYMLTDTLTTRQFSELTDMDIEVSRLLYSAYAANAEDYGQIVSGIDDYKVPLIDMFMYLYDQKEAGYVTLDDDLNADLEDMHTQLMDAKAQLQSEDYSRMLIYSTLPEESQETFSFLSKVHKIAARYYPENVYLVGDSTNDLDLSSSFVKDNVLISVLSAVFVIIVLIFTFKSAGLPVLLIMVIEGSVWINFSFPYLTGSNLFFMSYLVVSSIQMGANIDYAIVITNRYQELKKQMPIKEAIVTALNQAFPTILTSGSILASAGVLIGRLSSDPAVSSIGQCLGRGTIISIFLVMFVLPQILVLGDIIIEKTAFTLKKRSGVQSSTGSMRVHGKVRGYVSGVIDAEVHGIIRGSISALVETGGIENTSPKQLENKKTDSGKNGKEAADNEED